ncbi:MAG: hypothetical protein JOY80_00655 [Candidatus Dormibacteraeota bacterium]|nr:hypothetical protein [Candidatus Dormibacteraeota bacterium]
MTANGNSAVNGAAIGNGGDTVSPQVTIIAATIDGNTTATPRLAAPQRAVSSGGAAVFTDQGPITVGQSILFSNTNNGSVQECLTSGTGSVVSSGYNLADDTTCGFTSTGDVQDASQDPQLSPLAQNAWTLDSGSGPPEVGAANGDPPLTTQAIAQTSPALNTGPSSGCPATDARGVSRPQPQAGRCDKGAFEALIPIPVPSTGVAQSAAQSNAVPVGLGISVAGVGAALAVIAFIAAPRRRRRSG